MKKKKLMGGMQLMNKNNTKEIANTEAIARDFVDVKDIVGQFLYTKSGYIFSYLRVHPYNLDLLSDEEKKIKTDTLSLSFDGDRKDFTYCTFPRPIDLDDYKNFLKEAYSNELQTIEKRRLLTIMLKEAVNISNSGENFEHQHFLKIFREIGDNENDAKNELRERIREFKERYTSVGIEAEILDEKEIINLCNLFFNSRQVAFDIIDSNTMYAAIPQIRS